MKKLLLSLAILFAFEVHSQAWTPLSTGLVSEGRCFTVYNSKLIVGGKFTSAGGNITDNIAAWDGSNWSTFNSGLQSSSSFIFGGVNALSVYNGSLIAAGSITAPNSTTVGLVARWNGSTWDNISLKNTLFLGPVPAAKSLVSFNNQLVVGGQFDTIGGISANNIATWNGTSWATLGSGLTGAVSIGASGRVNALCVFNNELYAGGSFTVSGSTPVTGVAKWNGATWVSLGSGIPDCFVPGGYYSGVNCLAVYNNELYAGNCYNGISKWNGTSWVNVGGFNQATLGGVYTMNVFNNKLIIGGRFSSTGLSTRYLIAAWNGINWDFLGGTDTYNGLGGGTGLVSAVHVFNSSIYATGIFGIANEIPNGPNLNNITKFNGTVGIKENSLNNSISISPNPSTGQFTFEGLSENTSIEVTDLTGRIIYTGQLDESMNSINLQGKEKGVYMYKIKSKENKVQQGKLILN